MKTENNGVDGPREGPVVDRGEVYTVQDFTVLERLGVKGVDPYVR